MSKEPPSGSGGSEGPPDNKRSGGVSGEQRSKGTSIGGGKGGDKWYCPKCGDSRVTVDSFVCKYKPF